MEWSLGKAVEDLALKACPCLHRCLFIIFITILIGVSHYASLLIFSIPDLSLKGIWLTTLVWFIFNIVFNFVMANLVDPGTPVSVSPLALSHIDTRCRCCNSIKPPRCHHCSICDKCVLQMDHHCPWIGNCVGHHNRGYFINFLTYLTLGLAQVTVLLLIRSAKQTVDLTILTFILSLLICVGIFSIFHWIIALRGRTSLECCWDDPKYQPSILFSHNISLVYGTSNPFIFLLPRITLLRNPGHRWDYAI